MAMCEYPENITRRRAIRIFGAAAGLALGGLTVDARARDQWQRWDGGVMGADASIDLHGPNGSAGRDLIALCLAEMRRLEAIFSLHQPESALNRLNTAGRLHNAPHELVEILGHCRQIHTATGAAFDTTVQPLWRLYADHFAAAGAHSSGPPAASVAQALKLVDQNAVLVQGRTVRFARTGMAATFNGIAQGYIADRIAALLRTHGINRVMIDMGEIVARGNDHGHRPWRVGLLDPARELEIAHEIALSDQALATSGGYGLRFDRRGRFHHLLDPRTGISPHRHLAVSVVAPTAALADGLSTAFSAMSERDINSVLAHYPGTGALVTRRDGTERGFGTFPKAS